MSNEENSLEIPKTLEEELHELYVRAISGKSRKERVEMLLVFIDFLYKKTRREFLENFLLPF